MHRVSQSPTDPDFVQNPYPFYARARALAPVVFWEEYGMPVTTDLAAGLSVLKHKSMGRAPISPVPMPPHLAPFAAIEAHSMLELEPPAHTRLRKLVLHAFTSRGISGLAPEIHTLCHSLIDAFPSEGPFDLLQAYARPLPVIVIARLLGVPESMADQLLAWSNAMVAMYQAGRTRDTEDAAAEAARDFVAFLRHYIDERRTAPRDDLLTDLIRAEEAGDTLSTDELISTCVLLLNAGHEATVHTMGNGVKAILNGSAQDKITDDPATTVEEILRYDPPLHLFTRWVYADTDVAGHPLKAGDEIGVLLGAAGRDPAAWADADRFDATRPPKPHASFGAGLHFCVGAPLARLELQIALAVLFERCPHLALAEPPRYANLYHFHGLERLGVLR